MDYYPDWRLQTLCLNLNLLVEKVPVSGAGLSLKEPKESCCSPTGIVDYICSKRIQERDWNFTVVEEDHGNDE